MKGGDAHMDIFIMVSRGARVPWAKALMESRMQIILERFCNEGKLKDGDSSWRVMS